MEAIIADFSSAPSVFERSYEKAQKAEMHDVLQLMQKGKYEEAQSLLEHMEKSAEVLTLKGIALQRMGKNQEAITAYLHALQKEKSFNTEILLAKAYFKTGQVEKATQLARLIKPQDTGELQILNKFIQSINTHTVRDSKVAQLNKSILFDREGKTDEALALLDQLEGIYPEDQNLLYFKALLLLKKGCYSQAICYFNRLDQTKNRFDILYGLSSAYLSLYQIDTAKEYALSLEPRTGEESKRMSELLCIIDTSLLNAVVNHAYQLVNEKSFECAELYLCNYLACDPCNHKIRLTLARIYGLDALYDEGLRHACYVLWQDPYDREAWSTLADLYAWRGNFLIAVNIYRQLLSQHYDEALLRGLGYAYYYLKNITGVIDIACCLGDCDLYRRAHEEPYLDFPYPRIEVTYWHLSDSQALHMDKESIDYTWQYRNNYLNLHYGHIDSHSPGIGGYLDEFSFDIYSALTLCWTMDAGAGFAHINDSIHPTGHVDTAFTMLSSTMQAGVHREVYELTAEALDNHILYWDAYGTYTYFSGNVSYFGGTYRYRIYNDGNHNNLVNLYYDHLLRRKLQSRCSAFPFNPHIDLRYDFVYQNTEKNTSVGYFSGKNYYENRLSLFFLILNDKFEPLVEIIPTLTYVTYRTNGHHLQAFYFGGIANTYIDITPRMMLITGIKAGRYPFGGPDLYRYFEFASRLLYAF